MDKLFSFLGKNESHHFLRIAAKVIRVFYIVLGFSSVVYLIISGVTSGSFLTFLLSFVISIVSFCVIMFIGMVIEALLIGFSNIVENQFEELVLKNKEEETKEVFSLTKKQKANYEKLQKLNELKKSGAITDEEYDVKKKEFLDRV